MSFVRQVGYVINVGPVFVVPAGNSSQQVILQCSVQQIDGNIVWVTQTKEPAYVPVLNQSGGDTFPYADNAVTIDGYSNDQYVTLGTDTYKRPNFAGKNYNGSYQNIANDWVSVSFRAPNLIRNSQESSYYNGVDGTPPAAQTTVPTGSTGGSGVPVGGGGGTGNSGTGTGNGTQVVYKTGTATGTGTGTGLTYQQFEIGAIATIALIGLVILATRSGDSRRR